MFALVDCNTFYASCETIFRPDLIGKPVLVLSNNDGCVISRNVAAKTLEIPALVAFHEVQEQVERLGCTVFSSNYELYGDISARVMLLLEEMALELEVYSIDEAFLRLHDNACHAQGVSIRQRLLREIGMPACVGLAPTKTLAKLANRAAKKLPQLDGVCLLDTTTRREWLLARSAPQDIWGIGARLDEKLRALGIHNALQLAQADPKWLRRRFGVVLEKTVRELNGEPCLDLVLDTEPKQQIISTRSFSYRVTDLHELQQAISTYAARACERLRRQDGITASLWVYLISGSEKNGYLHRQSFAQLPHYTDDTRLIAQTAIETMTPLFRQGLRYKKCGIGLLDVRTRHYEQQDLFTSGQPERSRQLMAVLDAVNRRYGRTTLQLAGAGLNPGWAMKRQYMSPRYTTRWNELPTVRC
jgi:DNA polymerase V